MGLDPCADLVTLTDVDRRKLVVGTFGRTGENLDARPLELGAVAHLRPSRPRKSDSHASPIQELDDLDAFGISVGNEHPDRVRLSHLALRIGAAEDHSSQDAPDPPNALALSRTLAAGAKAQAGRLQSS